MTVQISAQPSSFGAPVFNVCGKGDGTQTCTLGTLQANQTTQLQARLSVPGNAPTGHSATLTGTAAGVAAGATASGSVSAIGSVGVVAPSPSPSPTPTHSSSPASGHRHGHGSGSAHSPSGSHSSSSAPSILSPLGTGLGGSSSLTGLLPLTGASGTGSGNNPGNLFPTINPSSGPSGSGGSAGTGGKTSHRPYHPRAVANALPLNTRQLGSQVAGLLLLALGIVIAVARVSLRKPRTHGKQ